MSGFDINDYLPPTFEPDFKWPDISHHTAEIQSTIHLDRAIVGLEDYRDELLSTPVPESIIGRLHLILGELRHAQKHALDAAYPDIEDEEDDA
jgi:hypothetical protein